MRLLFGRDLDVAEFVAGNLNVTIVPPFTAIGWADDTGAIIGGAVFNDYTGNNVELTIFGKPSASVSNAITRYIFQQLKCERVSARTKRSNIATRRLLGRHFIYEATLKRFYGNEDAMLYRLCRDECKWLKRL